MIENIERINDYKPEVMFEKTIWENIENDTFSLAKVLNNGDIETPSYQIRGKRIGYYKMNQDKEITLVIQLSTALKEMKKTLPNYAISEDTLKIKLQSEGKIKVNPSKAITISVVIILIKDKLIEILLKNFINLLF